VHEGAGGLVTSSKATGPSQPLGTGGTHVKPLAHTHAPVVVSQVVLRGHCPQATPEAPHNMFVSLASCSQDDPLQQPGHMEPPQEHEPLEHESPIEHGVHEAPRVPH
jgi:hypothetical protein